MASLAVALWSPLVVTAAWSTTWSPLTSEYQPPAETLTASMTETAHASVKACALSATFTASAHATCRSEDCAASATLTASLAVALWSPTGMDAVAVSLILTASLGTTDVVPGISSTMPRQAEDVVHEAVAVTPSLSVVLYCAATLVAGVLKLPVALAFRVQLPPWPVVASLARWTKNEISADSLTVCATRSDPTLPDTAVPLAADQSARAFARFVASRPRVPQLVISNSTTTPPVGDPPTAADAFALVGLAPAVASQTVHVCVVPTGWAFDGWPTTLV